MIIIIIIIIQIIQYEKNSIKVTYRHYYSDKIVGIRHNEETSRYNNTKSFIDKQLWWPSSRQSDVHLIQRGVWCSMVCVA